MRASDDDTHKRRRASPGNLMQSAVSYIVVEPGELLIVGSSFSCCSPLLLALDRSGHPQDGVKSNGSSKAMHTRCKNEEDHTTSIATAALMFSLLALTRQVHHRKA